MEFQNRLGEEVVDEAKRGDNRAQDCLMPKHENFVKTKAKSYLLIGIDKEDIYQEDMIGLYKVIKGFKSNRLTSFKAFAELCITR